MKMSGKKTISKILIIRPDAIGDVTLMIPLISSIKKSLPDVKIYTLQQAYTVDLLSNHPDVEAVLVDWKKSGKAVGVKGYLAYLRYIKSFKFDAVIQPFLEGYYASLMALARIPIRIGDRNKLLLRPLLNRSLAQVFRNLCLHETEQNIELARGLGVPIVPSFDMSLECNFQDESVVEALLKENGWMGERLIGVHPTTGGGNRAWLPGKYAELVDLIQKNTGYKVVLTGAGSGDNQINQQICEQASTNPILISGKTSLSELKIVVKKCDAFIGTDTGPTHIAAALGVSVLSISATKFVKSMRWGPWQTKSRIVGNSHACPYVCNPHTCTRSNCLDAISAEQVLKSLVSLLEDKSPVSLLENKKRWMKASGSLVLYCHDPRNIDEKALKFWLDELSETGFKYYMVCRSKRHRQCLLDKQVASEILFVLPLWRLIDWMYFLSIKDGILVHAFSGGLSIMWRFWMRQLSALLMYVPPVFFEGPISTTGSDVSDYYLRAFSGYFENKKSKNSILGTGLGS
ncbi:MAG: ADP-heptose:LPS heptosyltransferase [Candidatus Marinamargulisbacteria bacterium]|jgi:ADP-heptose:LPS heptosyltransferase